MAQGIYVAEESSHTLRYAPRAAFVSGWSPFRCRVVLRSETAEGIRPAAPPGASVWQMVPPETQTPSRPYHQTRVSLKGDPVLVWVAV